MVFGLLLRSVIGRVALVAFPLVALGLGVALSIGGVIAMLIAAPLVVSAGAYLLLLKPRGRQTHRFDVFIAAAPETVWNTYLFHCGHRDYRPGMRILSSTIVAQTPLTVRYEMQADYATTPSTVTFVYDLYEPYTRYRLTYHAAHDDDDSEESKTLAEDSNSAEAQFVEEGVFEPVATGTRLHVAITSPMMGFVLPWAAYRRTTRNFRALKQVCEGRTPEPPRGPLPATPAWEGSVFWVGFLVVVAWSFMTVVSNRDLVLVFVAIAAFSLGLRWHFLTRFFALG